MQPMLQAIRNATSDADLLPFETLHAVVFTDLSGYSAHPVYAHAAQRVMDTEETIDRLLDTSGGRLIKSQGDSHLFLFDSVTEAVAWIDALRAAMPSNRFCAGISWGYLLVCEYACERLDIHGKPVNEASFLGEDATTGTQVFLTLAAYAQLPSALRSRCTPGMFGAVNYWELEHITA